MKVSICCITYNQEKYIADALDGMLMQITSFDFEIVIGDDASTDKTLDIINSYLDKYPERIKLKANEINIGFKKNFTDTLSRCKVEYIAICEGDDYWTDPFKLQKQIDFLDANETHLLCFHQTKRIYDDGREEWYNNFNHNTSFDFIDLVQRPFISTVSSVFRNPNPLPDWFEEIASDWPLFLYIASKGKLYYMSDCMAVYRRHSEGVWSSLTNDVQYNNTIILLDKLDKIFGYKYHEYFEKSKTARHQIHYPVIEVQKKSSLTVRVKRKLKSIFFK